MSDQVCNQTIYHDQWYQASFGDAEIAKIMETELMTYALQRDEKVTWTIMDFDNPKTQLDYQRGQGRSLTNGQAMELSNEWCRKAWGNLLADLSGTNSVLSEQSLHDVMCNYCALSDDLRKDAMSISSCDCTQLSTGPADDSFTVDNDFCLQNSGHLLCYAAGRCSKDECHVRDFSCPRRGYDSVNVPLRGFGGDCSGVTVLSPAVVLSTLLLVVISLLVHYT